MFRIRSAVWAVLAIFAVPALGMAATITKTAEVDPATGSFETVDYGNVSPGDNLVLNVTIKSPCKILSGSVISQNPVAVWQGGGTQFLATVPMDFSGGHTGTFRGTYGCGPGTGPPPIWTGMAKFTVAGRISVAATPSTICVGDEVIVTAKLDPAPASGQAIEVEFLVNGAKIVAGGSPVNLVSGNNSASIVGPNDSASIAVAIGAPGVYSFEAKQGSSGGGSSVYEPVNQPSVVTAVLVAIVKINPDEVKIGTDASIEYKIEPEGFSFGDATLEITNNKMELVYKKDVSGAGGTHNETWPQAKWNQGANAGAYANPKNGDYEVRITAVNTGTGFSCSSDVKTLKTKLVIESDFSDDKPSSDEISSGIDEEVVTAESSSRVKVGLKPLPSGNIIFAASPPTFTNSIADLDNDPSEDEVRTTQMSQDFQPVDDGKYNVIIQNLKDLAGNTEPDKKTNPEGLIAGWIITLR